MDQHRIIGWLCMALLGASAIGARGQDDLLRGPEVQEQKSIVHHTMSGDFERVEGRPEMTAFAAITDDPELLQHAIEVELERTVAISMHLVDHIDLMKESTDASLSGDNKTAAEIYARLHELFDPEKRHDPLTPGLSSVLNEQQRSEYARLLEEYWNAWIDANLGDRMDQGKPAVRKRIRARLTTRLFNRELSEAYNISLKQYRDAMEVIHATVEPTDEQREAMRQILIAYIKETRLEPTPDQRRAATMRMYEVLDEERRARFFGYLLRIVVPDNADGG